MKDVRKFIDEAFEVIKKRAYENQIQGGFFSGLCQMIQGLESIAIEYLNEDDALLKELRDFKKNICKNE